MSESKRVLVTGASGFIGRQALAPLLERGYEVYTVGRRPLDPGPAGIRHRPCDLFSQAEREAALDAITPTHLLHLAWYAKPGKYWESTENLRWVAASLELMRGFSSRGGTRAVVAGSCAEYDWSFPLCKEQETPLRPTTLYGISKNALWSMLSHAAAGMNLSLAWGRIFFLYGEYEEPQRLVPSVIQSLLRNEPALCTHGRQVRDFMHVRDVARAFVALLDSSVTGAVNIASGDAYPIAQIVSMLGAELGKPELIRLGARPAPPGEVDELRADATRLQSEVGFRPRIPLTEGLRETIAWWRAREGYT